MPNIVNVVCPKCKAPTADVLMIIKRDGQDPEVLYRCMSSPGQKSHQFTTPLDVEGKEYEKYVKLPE